jgi:hypothetical protein
MALPRTQTAARLRRRIDPAFGFIEASLHP